MSHRRHRHLAVIISNALSSLITLTAASVLAPQVRPTWQAPTTDAEGTPLTNLAGCKVYHGRSSQSDEFTLEVGNILSIILGDLEEGQTPLDPPTICDGNWFGSTSSLDQIAHLTHPLFVMPSPPLCPIFVRRCSVVSGRRDGLE